MNERLFGKSLNKKPEALSSDSKYMVEPGTEDNPYGSNLILKSKEEIKVEPGAFDVERHPDGKIKIMVRKGSNGGKAKYANEFPDDFEGGKPAANDTEWYKADKSLENLNYVEPEYDKDLTPEQEKDLNKTLRNILEKYIPKPSKALQGMSLAALVALASTFKDEKQEVVEAVGDAESVTNVSANSQMKYIDLDLPIITAAEKVSAPEQITSAEPVIEVALEIPDITETKNQDMAAAKETDYEAETFPYDIDPMGVVADEKNAEVPEVPEVPDVAEVEEDQLGAFEEEVKNLEEEISPADITLTKEFADKPVVGAEEYTRQEYVVEAIKFDEWDEEKGTGVPAVAAQEFRRLFVGLCAKESRFDASRVSSAGAKGILQITQENWKIYGGEPGKETSLVAQVEVAGRMISDFYKYVNNEIGKESLDLLRTKYPDEDSFQRDLIVPLVFNAYISGSGRIGEAVRFYMEKTNIAEMPSGKDLYLAIADYAYQSKEGKYLAGYDKQSRGYVPKLNAFANRLNEDRSDRRM